MKIGQASSFRIEWVPGHFIVEDVLRDKVACPQCPSQGVLTASGPYALNRSMAGNGLIARLLVDKFADHIPQQPQKPGHEPLAGGGAGGPESPIIL